MSTAVTAGKTLEPERGSAIVCLPLAAADGREPTREDVIATLRSVLEHTDASTSVLLAGPAAQIQQVVEDLGSDLGDRTLQTLELAALASETQALNTAITATSPADIALVVAGVRVATNWLTHLQAAATSDSIIASATPWSLGLGGVEIFESSKLAQSSDRSTTAVSSIEELAARISEHSLRLWPRIAGIGPGCAYIRRRTLELLGPLNESVNLDAALGDLAIRGVAAGMIHVVADDVLVQGDHLEDRPTAATEAASKPTGIHEIQKTILSDECGRLHRALGIARTALEELSITIDGRALTSTVGGTQTYILELIAALARRGGVSLRALVPHDLSELAREALASLSDVELLSYEQALTGPPLSDVVHRPQQVFTPDDMTLLRLVGQRVVVGQQDLIAYHNHSYHPDIDRWRTFRRITRLALAAADQVVFFSEHARRDAMAEDLLPERRAHVVGLGAETLAPMISPGVRPAAVPFDSPFLLCVGADYAHKNRCFAIELTGALRDLGWTGCLVLAGSHVDFGSSRERESELLRKTPDLASCVIDLGVVDEPGKQWLYQHARALLYPTLYEGFGLLPLEAAEAGIPCLFAPQASLSELAGQAATLLPWDTRASAAAVWPLLTDGPERDQHVARLRVLALPNWDEVAEQLIGVYRRAIEESSPGAAPRAWQELDRESFIARQDADIQGLKSTAQEYQDAYHSLSARVAGGLPLIEEGGLLSPAQQRGLMRIASRRVLRAPILGPIGVFGRVKGLSDNDGS